MSHHIRFCISNSKSRLLAATFLAVLLATCTQAHAALLASEGFDYDNSGTAQLLGKSGGTGWTGNWSALGSSAATATSHVLSLDDTSLVSPAYLAPTGDRVIANGSGTSGGNSIHLTRTLAAANQLNLSTEGGIMYASLLLQKNGTYGVDPLPSGNNLEFGIGSGSSTGGMVRFGSTSQNAFFFAPLGGTSTGSAGSLTQNETYLLVVKIEAHSATPDVFSGIVFDSAETVPGSEPGSWDFSGSLSSTATIDRAWLFFGANTTGQFDEFRIGQTWTDVIGVPEPNSLLLASLTLISVVALRVRSRHR